MTGSDKAETICGSQEYMSPEMLLGQPYGKEVDWWALGTIIFEVYFRSI